MRLKYSQSLKKNHEFRRLYSRGKSALSPYLVVYCRRNGRGVNRVGITVGGKVGNAVKRNLVRRRLRESYRRNEERFYTGYDLVFVARVKTGYARYRQIEDNLLRLSGKLGLLRP